MDTPITEYELDVALGKAIDAGTPYPVVEELLEAAEHPERLDDVTQARVLIAASETLARLDHHDEAVEVARRAAESGSDEMLTPRAWLAKTLVEAGRPEEGLAEFRRGRRDDPDDWTVYQLAGETFESAGDPQQAVAWFTAGGKRAVEKSQRSPAYLLLTGRRRVRQNMGFVEDGQDRWVREVHDRMFAEEEAAASGGSRARGGAKSLDPSPGAAHPAHRVARNEPCSCGSGKKYKKCCGDPSAAG